MSKLDSMPHGSILLTPEGISSKWSGFSPLIWTQVAHKALKFGDTVILGATLPIKDHRKMDAFMLIGKHKGLISAMQPIPMGEWKPGMEGGYPSHWLIFGPRYIGKLPVAFAVCYEQLLVWPLAWQFLGSSRPRIILAPENHGWNRRGSAETALQLKSVEAWARLYGVRALISKNSG